MPKRTFRPAFLFSGLLALAFSFVADLAQIRTLEGIAKEASENLSRQIEFCDQPLSLALSEKDASQRSMQRLFEQHGTGIYYFENDSLYSWNNAQIPLTSDPRSFPSHSGISTLSNGLYLYARKDSGNRAAIALRLIRPAYEIQNRYLDNGFREWTGIPPEVGTGDNNAGGAEVNLNGKPLFALKGTETAYHKSSAGTLSLCFFIGGFLLLMYWSLRFFRKGLKHALVCTAVIVTARFLMVVFKVPAFLYSTDLYNVRLFGNAQSLLNGYLGDILLNALCMLFLAAGWNMTPSRPGKFPLSGKLAGWTVALWLSVCFFNISASSLIFNSTLNFDLLGIFNLHPLAFAGLAALAFISVSALLSCRMIVRISGEGNVNRLVFSFIPAIIVCAALLFVDGPSSVPARCWPLAIMAIAVFAGYRKLRKTVLLALHVTIISAITSALLITLADRNQQDELEVFAMKLSEKQDPALENEFSLASRKLAADPSLKNLIGLLPVTSDEIPRVLSLRYFNGYFTRYHINFSLFDEQCNPQLPNKEGVFQNEGFFEDVIRYHADSTGEPGLFFARNFRKNAVYVGRVGLGKMRLYVMMEPKQLEEAGSFPDLLLDQSQQRHEDIRNLSYAVYRSRQNTATFGAIDYPATLPDLPALETIDRKFVHRYFHAEENTDIIIATPARTAGSVFTYNSYILLFFSALAFITYLLYAALFTSEFRGASLTRRIQTIIIILLLTAITAVGVTSGRLIRRQFNEDNKQQLREKTGIIIDELNARMKTEMLFEPSQKELVNFSLTGFARLFKTDISLYTSSGRLFNTSQPRLYEMGLAGTLANPHALQQIRQNRSSAVIVRERAGSLSYLSLYMPLFDSEKQIAGYINLPYFARQNDLVNELSGIISAFINVYVILFVISLLAGLVLSGYITRPLRIIQQQLARISLGGRNEKIIWNTNDEIGKLVNAYNEMLLKLEESALLLARSEREGAWREMAKQVAHEIKNPLTPMKLNLQYLQHLMKSDPVDFKEKFARASAGIIEQIDSLATIASEFSSLARLPGGTTEQVNLSEIIRGAVQVFDQEWVTISVELPENLIVSGDREQFLRVFNNIIKNALQALEGRQNPSITITAREQENAVTVEVTDNGSGMDDEAASRVFTPNFTTKSTGSGLGLAMVRNIMEASGGTIWFETASGKGTSFFLRFVRSTAS